MYNAATGDSDEAIGALKTAAEEGRGFCLMALADPVLSRDAQVIGAALILLQELDAIRIQTKDIYDPVSERLHAILDRLHANQEWDQSDTEIAEVAAAVEALEQYRTSETESWGFSAFGKAMEEANRGVSPAHTIADWGEDYIKKQRKQLESLYESINRKGEIPLDSPRKHDGAWVVITASPVQGMLGGIRSYEVHMIVHGAAPGHTPKPVSEVEIERILGLNSPYKWEVKDAVGAKKAAPRSWAYLDR